MFIRLALAMAVTSLINVVSCTAAQATVHLSPMFGDGMVVQRDQGVNVWGKAAPGERVQVEIDGQRRQVVSDAGGKWLVTLSALKMGKELTLSVKGTNTIVLKNIQVGDVWICSGQSNMNFPLGASDFRGNALPENAGKLRIFQLKPKVENQPLDPSGSWISPTQKTVSNFPAIPVLLGRTLANDKGIPIGIIAAACDGAPLETFMPPETLARTHNLQLKLGAPHKLGGNFQCRLLPLLQLKARGVVWYQGESNLFAVSSYKVGLPAFIQDLRARMNAPVLPFIMVQLPNFGYKLPDHAPVDSFWADMREAQAAACRLNNVYMAVAIDTMIDNSNVASLHPKEKTIISQRLAQIAEKIIDGTAVPLPAVKGQRIVNDAIYVSFKNLTGSLNTIDKRALRGFQLSGPDHKFYWADAEICGNEVKVSSDDVVQPVAVRYAWGDNPDCNVVYDDLPLPPFRTDNWITKPKLNPAAAPTPTSTIVSNTDSQ
jgi:sialate O-acetylesterase